MIIKVWLKKDNCMLRINFTFVYGLMHKQEKNHKQKLRPLIKKDLNYMAPQTEQ